MMFWPSDVKRAVSRCPLRNVTCRKTAVWGDEVATRHAATPTTAATASAAATTTPTERRRRVVEIAVLVRPAGERSEDDAPERVTSSESHFNSSAKIGR